jgi:hypothetical protein
MRFFVFRTTSKMLLAGLLTVSLQAQQADALRITVTQGAIVPILNKKEAAKRKSEPTPGAVIVEVRDTSGRIVPGARVQVDSPASAGQPLLGWTDTEGRAYIDGVVPLGQEGKVPITAEARFNGMLGNTTFNNNVILPPAPLITSTLTFTKPNHKLRNTLIIAGVVGVAALAIALALTLPGGPAMKVIGPTPTSVALTGFGVGGPQ